MKDETIIAQQNNAGTVKNYTELVAMQPARSLAYMNAGKTQLSLIDVPRFQEREEHRPLMNISIRTYTAFSMQIEDCCGLHIVELKAGMRYVFVNCSYIFIEPDFSIDPSQTVADIKITGFAPSFYNDAYGNKICPVCIANNINLDVSELYYTNVETLQGVFAMYGKGKIESDVIRWDTSKIKSLNGAFSTCMYLETLDLSAWDTSSVTDMANLFSGCASLTNVAGLPNWDTSKVTDMSNMFLACSSLQSVDMTGWDFSSCESLNATFNWCSGLTTVKFDAGLGKCKAVTLDFAASSKWETCREPLLKLYDYDRLANGLGNLTITLHANSYSHLSSTDISMLKSKGYVIKSA